MKSGYRNAIDLAQKNLETLDVKEVCALTGAGWDGSNYLIPWFGQRKPVGAGSLTQQVLWLHYLISAGGKKDTGELMAFREILPARGYEQAFYARAVRPIVKKFGNNPGLLLKAGLNSGGEKADFGDCAVTVRGLPNVHVTYIVWGGDEEIPPEGSVLFDRSAIGWLPAEDLAVLASLGAYELISKV